MANSVQHTPPITRAERKRERTHQTILQAARRLCAEGGYGSLTVADIAAAADVGVGTFYYHFDTKDDVLIALMEEFLARMADTIRHGRANITDARERLRAGYRAFFTLTGEDQELLRVYFTCAGARETFAEEARQFFLNDSIDMIEMGQRTGAFRAGNPELLANWLIGATSEALQWLLAHDDPSDQRTADMLADLMLHGLSAS